MNIGTMEQRTNGMKKQAQELIDQAYQRGYKVGKDEAYKSPLLTKDAYMQGMNDAWNVIQKFYEMSNADMESIGLPVNDMVSPHSNIYYILQNISVNEAFDLIRAYEEQKKQKEDEIKVGDEVVWTVDNCDSGIVTRIESSENAMWLVKPDGLQICASKCKLWKKTGRHFPELAKFLKKMKEGEE